MRNVFAALSCFVVVALLATTVCAQQWVQVCDESGCTMVWQPASRPVARFIERLSDPPPVLRAAWARQAARAAATCGSDMPMAQATCGSDMPMAQATCGSDMPMSDAPPVLFYRREMGEARPLGMVLRRFTARVFERFRRPFSRRSC